MSAISFLDISLSHNLGNPQWSIGDYVYFFSNVDGKQIHSLLCVPEKKFIDISNVVDKTMTHLRPDTTLNASHDTRWFGLVNPTILFTVHFYFGDGVSNINIVHYDLKNGNKEIDRMSINFVHCVVECTGHTKHACMCSTGERGPHLSFHRLRDYEFLITLPYNQNFKQKSACVFNVQTLEKKILDDCLYFTTIFDNFFFKKSNNTYMIYNSLTRKELEFKCDKIEHIFTIDTNKRMLVYESNAYHKYMIITNDTDIENPINFTAELQNESIKVTASDRFYEYECIIDSYIGYKFITSFEMMYEIIKDAIDKNNRYVVMKYTKKDEQLNVEITVNVRYIGDKINFALIQKPLDSMEIMERKVDYLYKHNKINLL